MDMTYYTAVIFIEVFAAIVMLFLLSSNLVLSRKYRIAFGLEFIILIFIAVTEWLNTVLNGTNHEYVIVHYIVKLIEFSLTPVLPGFLLLNIEGFKLKPLVKALLLGNVLFLVIAAPFRFVFYMDADNVYTRGPGYFIFVIIYTATTLLLVLELVYAGRKFQNKNLTVIWVGVVFAISGVGLQLLNGSVRTSWLSVEISLIMSYIYFEGMLLQSDKMTGMLNRFAFDKHISELKHETIVVIFDVDNFKYINDTYGHTAGDAALMIISDTIKKTFSKDAFCYRIGGDEFCALMKKKSPACKGTDSERFKELVESFRTKIKKLCEEDPRITGVSVGYASTEDTESAALAFEIADQNMYAEKEINHKNMEARIR